MDDLFINYRFIFAINTWMRLLLQCTDVGNSEQRRRRAFIANGEVKGIRRRWLLFFDVPWRGFVARVRLCQVLRKTTSTLKCLSTIRFRAKMDHQVMIFFMPFFLPSEPKCAFAHIARRSIVLADLCLLFR